MRKAVDRPSMRLRRMPGWYSRSGVAGRAGDQVATCTSYTRRDRTRRHRKERLGTEMPGRTLLRGGHIISMDPEIGDIPGGDVLIEGEDIAAVAPSVDTTDCEIVDATGAIIIPGFIDSHRHTWETVVRGIAPDVTLDGYFALVLDTLAPVYRPQDVYAGNLLGTLEAIDAGVTTLLDWSHINNTPDHSDEAVRALRDAAIRAVYCYGTPNTSLADWWYNSTLTS